MGQGHRDVKYRETRDINVYCSSGRQNLFRTAFDSKLIKKDTRILVA